MTIANISTTRVVMYNEKAIMSKEWQAWFRDITDAVNTISGTAETLVSNVAYGPAWEGVETVAPSMGALYTQLQSMGSGYVHPVGDGNLHVPATGTTNAGKVLTAGATEGALSWETPTAGGAEATTVGDTATVNLTLTGVNITADVLPGGVDHNGLLNYVANKHVDHTGVSISAGTGMSGGGDISANRTLNCTITQYTDALARTACIAATAIDGDTTHAPCGDYVYDAFVAVVSALADKADLASPTFTGTVTTPAIKITTGAGLGKFLTSDADGDGSWADLPAGGSVATDVIWDAAGDLAVGTGANTGARLAIGAEGTYLSVVSGTPVWIVPTYLYGAFIYGAVVATENLAAGDFVNVHSGGVRKATATGTGLEAHGFVLTAFASGATAKVYSLGLNNVLSGLTKGTLWLSTTAGAASNSPPAAGNLVQRLGFAHAATGMFFTYNTPFAT